METSASSSYPKSRETPRSKEALVTMKGTVKKSSESTTQPEMHSLLAIKKVDTKAELPATGMDVKDPSIKEGQYNEGKMLKYLVFCMYMLPATETSTTSVLEDPLHQKGQQINATYVQIFRV